MPDGTLLAVTRDGLLWRGKLTTQGVTWLPLELPPDGRVGGATKIKPLPGMVVGADRVLSQDDIDRYSQQPAAPPHNEI